MAEQSEAGVVTTLLGLAGVQPSEEEVATMARLHGSLKAGADRLWLAEAADHEPATTFDPTAG